MLNSQMILLCLHFQIQVTRSDTVNLNGESSARAVSQTKSKRCICVKSSGDLHKLLSWLIMYMYWLTLHGHSSNWKKLYNYHVRKSFLFLRNIHWNISYPITCRIVWHTVTLHNQMIKLLNYTKQSGSRCLQPYSLC